MFSGTVLEGSMGTPDVLAAVLNTDIKEERDNFESHLLSTVGTVPDGPASTGVTGVAKRVACW